jgi:hypothetical protein
MKITHIRTKAVTAALGAAAAAAMAPAFLFGSAGTAQAQTSVVPFTDALGVSVHIVSTGGAPSSGWCTYTAVPVPGTTPVPFLPPLPVYGLPFVLQENGIHKLWFPGIQTGTKWDVSVQCPGGVDSPTQQVFY